MGLFVAGVFALVVFVLGMSVLWCFGCFKGIDDEDDEK